MVSGVFLLALLFGREIFSRKPTAPLYGTAFTTVLILIGTGTGAFGDEASSKFVTRIAQILLAVCYLVAALSLLQNLKLRERWLNTGRHIARWLNWLSRYLPGHRVDAAG
ncbi:MAG: hypothetical protein O7F73_10060 [Gammaproteobacteria bacterium]|nr:hypothetical protein [Gammaproteobacteria bacterium]